MQKTLAGEPPENRRTRWRVPPSAGDKAGEPPENRRTRWREPADTRREAWKRRAHEGRRGSAGHTKGGGEAPGNGETAGVLPYTGRDEKMEKCYDLPAIVWLKVTEFMHGWLQHEMGGACRVKDQRVLSLQHLPGVRDILRMEAVEDLELGLMKVGNSMSANRKNMLEAGLALDAGVIEREYGLTAERLKLFVPIECPRMCLTKYGVLRPWSLDVNLSREQAGELIRVIRDGFWRAVEEFDSRYAAKAGGERYASIDMVEAFCAETLTPDIFAEGIKREWNRRVKRGDNIKGIPATKSLDTVETAGGAGGGERRGNRLTPGEGREVVC